MLIFYSKTVSIGKPGRPEHSVELGCLLKISEQVIQFSNNSKEYMYYLLAGSCLEVM